MKLELNKAYLVTWRDHFSTEGFFREDLEGLSEDMVMSTVGFFVQEDEHYIRLARTIVNGHGQYGDIMSIAKTLLLTYQDIGEPS